jgi:hypothetical protein
VTLEEIAEVRPRLLDFTAEMLGGLPREDQRAAGELGVRGLLTDGQRKSMVPMAERLGTGHQRLQQFITSSTWDYAAVRRNVARWFASSQPAEALVVDDTGFPEDGNASPCVARQYSGTLGKTANCQIGVRPDRPPETAVKASASSGAQDMTSRITSGSSTRGSMAVVRARRPASDGGSSIALRPVRWIFPSSPMLTSVLTASRPPTSR